jgi:hypothetical protein
MFKRKREQRSLFGATTLLPDVKRERAERTWAAVFRDKALPLIEEERFRHLFCKDNGRPNKPVQTVIGVLVLKEMFDLTDLETLERLDFDLLFQVALGLDVDEAHCCQKTLHNFRVKLSRSSADALLFKSVTDGIIEALGVDVGKQRLDSTHIVSNIARLTRLGLFCETIRVFLEALKKSFPKHLDAVPKSLRERYLKEDGTATRFGDAKSSESQRRLTVCARDVYRLVDRFRGCPDVNLWEAYSLLVRLLKEQCEITKTPTGGDDGDADTAEPGVPVELKEPEKIDANSLQSPHDPDVTYSGHKGKGYEVQIAETHGNGDLPEIITHVEVTRSCDSDAGAALPILKALAERDIQPEELVADTTYSSTDNMIAAAAQGTELLGPVPGTASDTRPEDRMVKGDFIVDPHGEETSKCIGGQTATKTTRSDGGGVLRVYFNGAVCATCPLAELCPARILNNGTRVLTTTVRQATLEQRRAYEQTVEFKERYAARAGIEATNSELKRKHGLGHLRVRRQPRVRLAVYLKAIACNVKRMVTHFLSAILEVETLTETAVAGAS